MRDLDGRTAIVTGAAQGMGRAIATALAEAGAHVWLWGRRAGPLEEARDALRGAGHAADMAPCDVSLREHVERAMALPARLDVLVNNAGVSGEEAPVLDMEEQAFDRMVAINLKGPFLCSQAAGRRMRGHGGAIVNNASVSAYAMDGRLAHYSATKAGLLALTRNMAVELAPWGIRVNAVSPGYVATEMTTSYFDADTLARLDGGFARVPLGRLIRPEEVAEVVAFLASPRASAVTGVSVPVDGGLMSNLYILESVEGWRPA